MPGGDDATRGRVIAAVAALLSGISEEDAIYGTGSKLVRRCGCSVWVATTPKNPEMIIRRRNAIEEFI
jgi:hypothetical protein